MCCLPVVAETWDGDLSDIYGFHVTKQHAFQAMERAAPGPVAEGNVGGGTGMICLGFKGGIGTASRKLGEEEGGFTVGALVQCNFGVRRVLRIAGVPVGQEITEPRDCYEGADLDSARAAERCPVGAARGLEDQGSIIVVIGTDAPLLPHQLRRVARRASLGIGRMGGIAGASSGDLFIAFSTTDVGTPGPRGVRALSMLGEERITPIYEATVQATEEAIVNAMLAARTMRGADGYVVPALPHDRLRQVMRKYNRLIR
jgi:L-aminopeptidase/D-esterase-like protein